MSAFDIIRENLGKWAIAVFLGIALATPFVAPFWYRRQPRSPGRRLLKLMLLLGLLVTVALFYPAHMASRFGLRMGFHEFGSKLWLAPGAVVLLLTDVTKSVSGLALRFGGMLLIDVLLYAAAGFILGFLLDAFWPKVKAAAAAKGSS